MSLTKDKIERYKEWGKENKDYERLYDLAITAVENGDIKALMYVLWGDPDERSLMFEEEQYLVKDACDYVAEHFIWQ